MVRIGPLDPAMANPKARDLLDTLRKRWGASWNIAGGMAHNPAVLEGFMALHATLDRTGLSPSDREVICMEMARANGCHYCVPAHRFTASEAGVDGDMIERVAQGETLAEDSRAAVIQDLTRRLVAAKGKLSDQEFQDFQDQGVTVPEMIAVVAEIAHCTLTNLFNRLAETDLDPFLEDYRDG